MRFLLILLILLVMTTSVQAQQEVQLDLVSGAIAVEEEITIGLVYVFSEPITGEVSFARYPNARIYPEGELLQGTVLSGPTAWIGVNISLPLTTSFVFDPTISLNGVPLVSRAKELNYEIRSTQQITALNPPPTQDNVWRYQDNYPSSIFVSLNPTTYSVSIERFLQNNALEIKLVNTGPVMRNITVDTTIDERSFKTEDNTDQLVPWVETIEQLDPGEERWVKYLFDELAHSVFYAGQTQVMVDGAVVARLPSAVLEPVVEQPIDTTPYEKGVVKSNPYETIVFIGIIVLLLLLIGLRYRKLQGGVDE